MQMLDVLKRLAELDANNKNIVEASKPDFLDLDKDGNKKEPMKQAAKQAKDKKVKEGTCSVCHEDPCGCDDKKTEESSEIDLTVESVKYLAGIRDTLEECGMMPPMMGGSQPATFSINASAQSGDEVAGMINQIMNLAGVHKPSPAPAAAHMPGHDAGPLTSEPPLSKVAAHAGDDGGADLMRATLDKLNPKDEDSMAGGLTDPMGHEAGGMGAAHVDDEDAGGDSPVAAMADEVRDMADELKGTSKEELGLESYDNTPVDPTAVPAQDSNGLAYNPNAGGHNKGLTTSPTAMAEQLMAEYKKFVSEAKSKCCCEEKGKKSCPVHSKKMDESKFKKLEKQLAAKGAKNPGGLAKYIGDKKYGKKAMEKKAAAGRK